MSAPESATARSTSGARIRAANGSPLRSRTTGVEATFSATAIIR